jgi:hypothetical protein
MLGHTQPTQFGETTITETRAVAAQTGARCLPDANQRGLTLDHSPECILYDMQVHSRPSASMQIGEAAKLSALTVDAIRFYERRALLPKAPRTAGRFRVGRVVVRR